MCFVNVVEDEEDARKRGIMSMEDYEKVKRTMVIRQVERDQKLRNMAADEQQELMVVSLLILQRVGRGYNGRKKNFLKSSPSFINCFFYSVLLYCSQRRFLITGISDTV
ncbi:MAG: hypothetical protein EB127_27885 [Alphaproteobacteria bacterium]|nr:hypothetical protein [Alphaproteobacteria bacterium]